MSNATPTYLPGFEPENIKRLLDTFLDDVNKTFPDGVIVWSEWKHEKWDKAAGFLCQNLGYAKGLDFLEAYGYSIVQTRAQAPVYAYNHATLYSASNSAPEKTRATYYDEGNRKDTSARVTRNNQSGSRQASKSAYKEKTESAIVFFDEIDKKGSKNKDDVGGQGVLNMLLKFLDGTKYNATPSQSGLAERVEIDTSKMIVIAGGAFTDVYDRDFEHGIGFGHEVKKPYKPSLEDFVDKGMMTREFMGRFPSIIRLRDLNKEDMIQIMDKSSVSPIKLEKERYKAVGVKLNINDDVKEYAATKAVKSKAGARALTGIISEITNKSFGDALNNRGKYKDITITKETIEDPSNYQYTLKDNQKIKQKKAYR